MLFTEITAVYFDNNMNPVIYSTGKRQLLDVKAGGVYEHHSALKSLHF
jgi:hypothetical protein